MREPPMVAAQRCASRRWWRRNADRGWCRGVEAGLDPNGGGHDRHRLCGAARTKSPTIVRSGPHDRDMDGPPTVGSRPASTPPKAVQSRIGPHPQSRPIHRPAGYPQPPRARSTRCTDRRWRRNADRWRQRNTRTPARPEVDDDGEIEPASSGPDVCDVAHPGLVRPGRLEVPLEPVRRDRPGVVRIRRRLELPASAGDEPVAAHRRSDASAAAGDAVGVELRLQSATPVASAASLECGTYMGIEPCMPARGSRRAVSTPVVVARPADLENAAHRRDCVVRPASDGTATDFVRLYDATIAAARATDTGS